MDDFQNSRGVSRPDRPRVVEVVHLISLAERRPRACSVETQKSGSSTTSARWTPASPGSASVSPPGRRLLLRFVRSGSETGVDAGGCSATRAVARCACRSRRIGPPAGASTTPATAPSRAVGRSGQSVRTVDDAAEPEIGENEVAAGHGVRHPLRRHRDTQRPALSHSGIRHSRAALLP